METIIPTPKTITTFNRVCKNKGKVKFYVMVFPLPPHTVHTYKMNDQYTAATHRLDGSTVWLVVEKRLTIVKPEAYRLQQGIAEVSSFIDEIDMALFSE